MENQPTMSEPQPVVLRDSMERHVRGAFSFMLGDKDGKPLWDAPMKIDNVAVTSGRAWLLRHIMQNTIYASVQTQIMQAIGIGTSAVAPSTSDVLLGGEISRLGFSTETDNSASAAPNVIWAASWATNQGNGTLAECGIFNQTVALAQTMLAHATFTATFAKTTSNTLTVSYTLSA